MTNDAQKCEELVYGMELIAQTLSDYVSFHYLAYISTITLIFSIAVDVSSLWM